MNKNNSFLSEITSGSIAGACSRTIVAPFERIKIILQTQQISRMPEKEKYQGMINAIKRIPKEQGFFSLWRGNAVNLTRVVPSVALRFTFFSKYKQIVNDSFLNKLSAGSFAALSSLLITHPLDVIRLKLSVDQAKIEEKLLYNGFFDCAKQTLKNEGFLAFYKGLAVSILGVVPYFGISFGIYDAIKTQKCNFWLLNANLYIQLGLTKVLQNHLILIQDLQKIYVLSQSI